MNAEFLKAIENISQTELDGIDELNEQVRDTVDEMENYFSKTEFEFERTGSNYRSLRKGFDATDLLLELYMCFNNDHIICRFALDHTLTLKVEVETNSSKQEKLKVIQALIEYNQSATSRVSFNAESILNS